MGFFNNRFTHSSIVFGTLLDLAILSLSIGGLIFLHRVKPAGTSIVIHGATDVMGHLLTATVAARCVRALELPVPALGICFGAVVLDTGHLLGWMGVMDTLRGSTRNGSHALVVVAVLACVGFIDRKHARVWLGIAVGALSHLWRDMGTGTVALLWPYSDTVYGTTFTRYIAVLGGLAIAMIGSAALLAVQDQSGAEG